MTDLTKVETITVADGKYIISNNNGALTVLRNGEPWNRDLIGDNLVYWMFVEIQQLRAALAAQQITMGQAQKIARDCMDLKLGDRLPDSLLSLVQPFAQAAPP